MYNSIRNFAIFALLAFTSCEDKDFKPCAPVTYSDAQPIQFWPIDCDTFNEKEVDGVFSKCFCQPFECTDEIKIQLKDDGYLEDYLLEIFDSEGSSLHTAALTKTIVYRQNTGLNLQFTNNEFDVSISGWDQLSSGGDIAYSWQNPSSARSAGAAADALAIGQTRPDNPTKGWPPGTYQVSVKASNQSTGGSAPFTQQLSVYASDLSTSLGTNFSLSGTSSWDVGAGSIIRTVSFTLDKFYRYLWFRATKQGAAGGYQIDFTVDYIQINVAPTTESLEDYALYSYSFTPESLGICDEMIQIKISNDSTPDVEILKSDCIHVKSTWADSQLINYSNHSNFAGLYYLDVSPDTEFNLRVPAVFFHERFPAEQEVLELSNSQNIQLFAQAKAQKLFEVGSMPYYMHRKLLLVLQHQFVTIGGQEWVKRENYEMGDSSKRWPLRRATVWLDEKNYIVRNVL